MTCCASLQDGKAQVLPFDRTLATAYYDGPTEGFTECSQCGRTFAFRMLDWDARQDVRIIGFSPSGVRLSAIAEQVDVPLESANPVILVHPSDEETDILKQLLAVPFTHVTAIEAWPGKSAVWRDVSVHDTANISDWFSFLGISRMQG